MSEQTQAPSDPAPSDPAPGDPARGNRAPSGGRAAQRRARQQQQRASRRLRQVRVAGIVAAAIAIAGVTAAVVLLVADPFGAAPRRATDPAAVAAIADPDRAAAILSAGVTDITAVSTYDYRDLDTALQAGLRVTTGAFQQSFRTAMTGSVAAAARTGHTVQTFTVRKAGIGAITADGATAKVLVFGAQQVAGGSPDSSGTTLVTLTATLQRAGTTYLISDLTPDANAGLPPGTPGLSAAARAGQQEVLDLLTLRRAYFPSDQQRALEGAIDPLRAKLVAGGKTSLATLQQQGFDLTGTLTAFALESAQGDTATLLVAATGTRVNDDGSRSAITDGRYEVTVKHTAKGWRTSAVAALT